VEIKFHHYLTVRGQLYKSENLGVYTGAMQKSVFGLRATGSTVIGPAFLLTFEVVE